MSMSCVIVVKLKAEFPLLIRVAVWFYSILFHSILLYSLLHYSMPRLGAPNRRRGGRATWDCSYTADHSGDMMSPHLTVSECERLIWTLRVASVSASARALQYSTWSVATHAVQELKFNGSHYQEDPHCQEAARGLLVSQTQRQTLMYFWINMNCNTHTLTRTHTHTHTTHVYSSD